MSQSVVVRRADGTLDEACLTNKEEAEAFLKSAGKSAGKPVAKSALPTE